MGNGRQFKKSAKPVAAKDEYYQLDKWVINASQLERTSFLQAENTETNFGFRCYLGANQFEVLSKNPTELHKRLQFIQSITPSLLLCKDVTEMLKTVIGWAEHGLPDTIDVVQGTEEESQAILDRMKAEDMLRKVTEGTVDEVNSMIESGEIDIEFMQKTLKIEENG